MSVQWLLLLVLALAPAALAQDDQRDLHAAGASIVDWARLRDLLFPFWSSAPTDGDCPLGTVRFEGEWPTPEYEHVATPKKEAWEQALGGQAAARPSVQARLRGWPQHVLVDRQSLPQTDHDFAWQVARDTWRGLDALTDRDSGLPIDHVRLGTASVDLADAQIGDYTNVTTVGTHLIATVGAFELGLLSRSEALERIGRVLDTLMQVETHAGFFFNYYDTTSLERTSNLLSFVDLSWLSAGLMVVRTTLPELADRGTALLARMDYGLLYDPSKRQMSHGYFVHRQARSPFHYGVFYTEARLGSLIAIGKGDVPEDLWFGMVRTYSTRCTGQMQIPKGVRRRNVRGHTVESGYYEWGGVRYVPSWGGSMFEALMPALVLDEVRYAPRSLGANDVAHAVVQRRYALEALGYPVWGLSSSTTPEGDSYSEYGVRELGARGYHAGAVSPHAAALALSVTPDDAIADLRQLAERYDLYGDYGFYDAVDPLSGRVAHTYLTLDQTMLFIALANYLNDHCIQKAFAADPIAQRALPMIGEEAFFDGP